MKKLIAYILIIIPFILKAQYIPLNEQKADLIFKIFNFLVWKNDVQKDAFNFGVYKGSKELINALKKRKPSTFMTGITIQISNVKSIGEIPQYDIIIVEKQHLNEIEKILLTIKGTSTVLFTEEWNDKEKVVFNLFTEKSGEKVNFEYNLENLSKYNVSILNLKGFYALGGIDLNARKLLNKTKQELLKTEKLLKQKTQQLENQKKLLAQQQKQIEAQKQQLEQQKQQLSQQQQILNQKIHEIEIQQNRLNLLQNQLKIYNIKLQEQAKLFALKDKQLQQKQQQITAYEHKVNKLLKQYKEQEQLLKQQIEESKRIQKEVEQKKAELRKLSITIQIQRYALLIFSVLLIIIGILTFIIFRNYKQKKTQNILLAEQKSEIEAQARELEKINAELEKLSLVASETSNAVVILNQFWQVEWLNKGFTKLYGYTLQLLETEYGINIKDIPIYDGISPALDKVIQDKESHIFEHKVLTKENKILWIQTNITPITDEYNNIKKLVLIDSDITKIKEAEEEIRRKNQKIIEQAKELELKNQELEKLSLVAEKTDNGVAIADATGTIEWVNPGFERVMGLSFKEFTAKYGDNIIFPFFEPEILEIIEQALKNKQSATFTYSFKVDITKKIWLQTSLTPLVNNNGKLTRLFAIYSDITKIKQAEEKIAKQNKNIRDSIKYASRIQRALLPSETFIASYLPNSFVLYLPKDIVSGDFYWLRERNGKIFFTAADCTGHGVPGAFMSLLGISFLNEIIVKINPEKLYPNYILDELREMIISSLQQYHSNEHNKDGIDMALIMLDKEKQEIQYAGANNQALIIRNNNIIELQPDDMPIGYYRKMRPFSKQIFKYQKGDVLYLFSDGYVDQFGGPRNKKFMITRFRNLLLQIYHLPMDKQKQILLETHLNWRGQRKQLDDILVFGIKL